MESYLIKHEDALEAFCEMVARAALQPHGKDGIRKTRFAVISHDSERLSDIYEAVFFNAEQSGINMSAKNNPRRLRYSDEGIECDVIFTDLNKEDDVIKFISTEFTSILILESTQLAKEMMTSSITRACRFPSVGDCPEYVTSKQWNQGRIFLQNTKKEE